MGGAGGERPASATPCAPCSAPSAQLSDGAAALRNRLARIGRRQKLPPARSTALSVARSATRRVARSAARFVRGSEGLAKLACMCMCMCKGLAKLALHLPTVPIGEQKQPDVFSNRA